MKKLITTVLFLHILSSVAGQNNSQEQLGIQYFQNKEYDKAIDVFSKIYDKNPSPYLYYYYCQSLINISDFKNAEKLIKKQIKLYPASARYGVDLGYIYELSNQPEKAQKEYADLLKNLPAKEAAIRELYGAFAGKRMSDYAIEAIKKGRKLLNNNKLFSKELTDIYIQQDKPEKVIDEIISLVEDDDAQFLETAESVIQNLLSDDSGNKNLIAISTTLKRTIQKYPNNKCYFQLLYWVYRLNKQYSDALILAKAVDKRENSDGGSLYQLGLEATRNHDYQTAIECFQTVIKKGEKSSYSLQAKFALIDTRYTQLTENLPIKLSEAILLEKEFHQLLNEYGILQSTTGWIKKYAHLLAFYLDKSDEAIDLLTKAIEATTRDNKDKAVYKIDLADIQLYNNRVWDATLLYQQVEKDFPNDTIGFLAKYKNAKLAFYIGEFEWAKSQLDILKAATSKLIANDAMYCFLIISDNEEDIDDEKSEEDSTLLIFSNYDHNKALRYFAKADFLNFKNKPDKAIEMLDSAASVSPAGPLNDDILYQKAKIFIRQANYIQAEKLLIELLDKYSDDILGDDATFLLAQLYEYYLKDTSKAMEYYQQLMKNYPDSLYIVNARKNYRNLRGDPVNY